MNYEILIGDFRLTMLESVEVMRSVEHLADTAVIVLPGARFNKALEVENEIKVGDKVTIYLWYNDREENLKPEFEGYLESISSDDHSIKLNCEDEIFNYKKGIENKEFVGADVKQVLEYVNTEIGKLSGQSIGLDCDYSFRYDKFMIFGANGFDVLKKVQEETKANIFFKDNTLHVHPQYQSIGHDVYYDFAVNIEKSQLKYKDAAQRKVFVEISGRKADGTVIKATAGLMGGDKISINMGTVSDLASLQKMADNQLNIKSYTGYEGSIIGWLVPRVEPTCKIHIRDKDYEFKNGAYYCVSVKTNFSQSGAVRTVSVGKKLD